MTDIRLGLHETTFLLMVPGVGINAADFGTQSQNDATATMTADLVPAEQVVTVAQQHDRASQPALWHLVLDQKLFEPWEMEIS